MVINILTWIGEHILSIITILAIFFEIVPIKISPITWLVNIMYKPIRKEMSDMKTEITGEISEIKEEIGSNIKQVNTDLNEKMKNIQSDFKKEIKTVKAEQQLNRDSLNRMLESYEKGEMSRIRWEIIEFSSSIDNGQKHLRDEFRHIIDDNERYHELIKKYNMTNGFFEEEFEKIKKYYDIHKDDKSVYI